MKRSTAAWMLLAGIASASLFAQSPPEKDRMTSPALMVTHYCAAGNQPRMVATSTADTKVITFTFKDVTNLASPTAGHMRGLVLTMIDADHHTQQWTFRQDGKDQAVTFTFTRKK